MALNLNMEQPKQKRTYPWRLQNVEKGEDTAIISVEWTVVTLYHPKVKVHGPVVVICDI